MTTEEQPEVEPVAPTEESEAAEHAGVDEDTDGD